jgi:hypothetical protein
MNLVNTPLTSNDKQIAWNTGDTDSFRDSTGRIINLHTTPHAALPSRLNIVNILSDSIHPWRNPSTRLMPRQRRQK